MPAYSTSPLWGPLGIGAFMFMLFGLFFLMLWWRGRDAGMAEIGSSVLLVAAFFGAETLGLVRRPTAVYGPVWVSTLLETASILMSVGLARYIDALNWRRHRLLWLAVAPQAGLIAAGFAGIEIPRTNGNVLLMSSQPLMAAMVWRAARREPGAGHRLVAASLLLLPAAVFSVPMLGVDLVYARYAGVPARLTFYVTLMVVATHRRRRQLEAEVERRREAEKALAQANTLLEQRIGERTAHLRDMLAGLEGFNQQVSHDLRGPIGGIEELARAARQALRAGRREEFERMLAQIEQQAGRSAQLVAALLELARVGHAPLQRRTLALDALAEDAVQALRVQRTDATRPAVVIHPMPAVEGDADLLRTALLNLLDNACKFAAGGGSPRIEVGGRRRDGGLAVFVRDHGPGFEPADAATLFQPFTRLDGGVEGHGIGLSIVRRIVERHGGRVWAEAWPGQGACFWFTLPLAPSPAATPDAARHAVAHTAG